MFKSGKIFFFWVFFASVLAEKNKTKRLTDDCFLLLLLAFIVCDSPTKAKTTTMMVFDERENEREMETLYARARVEICCCFFEMNSTT